MHDDARRNRVDVSLRADLDARDDPDASAPREDGEPYRILVLGDARGVAGEEDVMPSTPRRIDRDTIEDVFAAMRPRVHVHVPPNEALAEFEFTSLDHFHPDAIDERQPYFREFAAEWNRSAQLVAPPTPKPEQRPDRPPRMSSEVLEAMLEEADENPTSASYSQYDLDAFLKRSLRSVTVREPTLEERTRDRQVAIIRAAKLRAVLLDPAFRAVERFWRGLDLLLRRIPDDVRVHVYVSSLPRERLSASLETAIPRLLAGPERGARWSLVVGDYEFGPSEEDAVLLARVAAAAAAARVPWVSSAAPALVGAPALAGLADAEDWATVDVPAWDALRGSAVARHVALAAPGVLLRLPYGRAGDRCERVQLEEGEGMPRGATLLWGGAPFVIAAALADSAARNGRGAEDAVDLDGLTMYTGKDEEGPFSAGPVAALLPERTLRELIARGATPLLGHAELDRVRVPGVWSVARPAGPLATM